MADTAVNPRPGARARRLLLVVLAIVALPLAMLAFPKGRLVLQLIATPAPEALRVPVRGVAPRALVDTWGAPRSGGRAHRGIDIFARRGTEIVSPVDGLVLDRGRNRLGGNIVRVLGPGPRVHYFAHLERFAEVGAGSVVRAGDVIGYVGDSGNARGTPPHLHYGVYALFGGAENPFPLLARKSRD